MAYRDKASFGKRQEFVAISELLRRGFDVYATLVDDQHIDCIIRNQNKDRLEYLDIQIKARSRDCKPYNAARFAAMDIQNPRPNYFFIFYSEQLDTYWVFPSLRLVELASQNKKGKNVGKYHINLAGYSRKDGKVYPYSRFKKYENAFRILKIK